MRVLIVGLGSVGRRHANNLLALGVEDLAACRVRGEAVPALAGRVREYADLDVALEREAPQAVFVTNPTALHVPVAIAAARRGCHLFIEKPLGDSLAGLEELARLSEERKLVVMVGCNLRFHPGYRRVKTLLNEGAIGRPLSARFEVGQYLPDWHPGEDYRRGYSARAALGGGVILTLIHELDFAYDLFGDVARVGALTAKAASLETDVEDLAEILLGFRSGLVVSVHLDHVQQPARRRASLLGEAGVIDWDILAGEVCWAHRDHRRQFDERAEWNDTFRTAIAHFLDCIALGKTPSPSLAEGRRVLEIALAARASAAAGTFVSL